MAIGAPFESGGTAGINGNQNDNSMYASGAVYVFTRQGGSWTQLAYVKASNPGQSDHFGSSVKLSRDGNTMAVAAHFESSGATGINGDQQDNTIPQAGAAYIFTRTGGSWTQQAYLKASNTGWAGEGDGVGDGDQFGFSMALSGDGQTVAVGAMAEDSVAQGFDGDQNDDSARSAGAVYVFSRTGNTWAQQAYVKASDTEGGDTFGFSVALNFDGSTLAVGAFTEDGAGRTINPPHDNDENNSGALYVFTRENGGWSEQAYIKGSRGETSDGFGFATAISEDGNTIAVGAGDEACLTPGVNPPGCADDAAPQAGGEHLGRRGVRVRPERHHVDGAGVHQSHQRAAVQLVRRQAGAERRRRHAGCRRPPRGQCRPRRPPADDPAVPATPKPESVAGATRPGRGIGRGVRLHAQRKHVDGGRVRERRQRRDRRRIRQLRGAQRRRTDDGGRRAPGGRRGRGRQLVS